MSVYHHRIRTIQQLLLKSRTNNTSILRSSRNNPQSYRISNARFISSSRVSTSLLNQHSESRLQYQPYINNGFSSRMYCSSKPPDDSEGAPSSAGLIINFQIKKKILTKISRFFHK